MAWRSRSCVENNVPTHGDLCPQLPLGRARWRAVRPERGEDQSPRLDLIFVPGEGSAPFLGLREPPRATDTDGTMDADGIETRGSSPGSPTHPETSQGRPRPASLPTPVPPNYPWHLERVVTSSGNLRYRVRPIRPDDAPRLVEFHNHLSPHSAYLRFFTFHPRLSAAEVERFTCVDYEDRLALVAEIDDHLIAVGRYDRHVGTSEAEVAFVVGDDYQFHGIGSLLLDELARAAREKGITTFLAETLRENHTMLGVFMHSGFPVTTETDHDTVALRFPIEPSEASRAALAGRERSRHVANDGK